MVILTLGVPFYMIGITVADDAPSKDFAAGCHVITLYSWNKAYCYATDQCGPLCANSPYNWRDDCFVAGARPDCPARKTTYDTALAFVVLSFICTFLVLVGFIVRCCGRRDKDRSRPHAIVGCIGLLCMIIAVSVFASRLPKALIDDAGGVCLPGTPCDSFSGSQDITPPSTDPNKKGKAMFFWGPAGWICGIITIPFYLYVICCAFSRTIDKDRPLFGGKGSNYQVLTG
jgi:hypothetical protein